MLDILPQLLLVLILGWWVFLRRFQDYEIHEVSQQKTKN